MIYNVIIKGFSVGITRDYSEAKGWLGSSPASRESCIRASVDGVPNFRSYKC